LRVNARRKTGVRMKFGPQNFLFGVKNIVPGSDSPLATGGAVPADGGFLLDVSMDLNDGVFAGSTITYTTASTVPIISAAAATTLITTYGFQIPRDYDETSDKVVVRILARDAGTTNTPTLTVASSTTIMNATGAMAAGVVIGNPGVTAPVSAALSSTLTEYEFDLSGQGLTRDSILSFTITASAHTTDAVQIFAVGLVYASCLVSWRDAVDVLNHPLR
jgi:hypothetical protein